MNQNEKKEIMGKFAKKLENAIKREVAVTKEMYWPQKVGQINLTY